MYTIYTKNVCMPPGYIKKILLVMKITTLFLFLGLMQVSAAGLAQKLTLVKNPTTLRQLFLEINKQTTYNVIWSADEVNGDIKLNANFKNTPLLEVLDKALDNTNLEYTISNKTVLIKVKAAPAKSKPEIKTEAPPITVTGKVTDELGNAMPGVTVKIKNTTQATVTDAKGNFSIVASENSTLIVFSFVGFESQEFIAGNINSGNLTVILKASTTNLKEVIIDKGYYYEKERLSTSSVASVKATDIEKQPVTNILTALEGRVAGLNIQQYSGVPDGKTTVNIRGYNSLRNNASSPLYVIDGVPYSSDAFTTVAGTNSGLVLPTGSSPLSYINPADIESIDVLKDADATAIYGSRGANGVILITTKKGKAGTTKLNANVYSGAGEISKKMNLLNLDQYLEMRHEAFKNDGINPKPSDYDVNGAWDTTRSTDWQKTLIGGTAHITDVQTSVSGGSENTQFLIGAGYHRETTVFPGDFSMRKTSVHANLQHSSDNKKFKISFNASFLSSVNDLPQVDLTPTALSLPPDAPALYDANGSLNFGTANNFSNPLAYIRQKYNSTATNLISNSVISYLIIPGLSIKSNFGYTQTIDNELSTTPLSSINPLLVAQGRTSSAAYGTGNFNTWIIEPQLEYKRQIGHGDLNVLIGSTFQQNKTNKLYQTGFGFTNDALLSNVAAIPSQNLTSSESNSEYRYNALYGRVNYTLNDKYVLNLTARRDGSSRFGPGRQIGNFGSAGVAWIFSQENLVKDNAPFLSTGKLRANYGLTGNDQIGDYQYLQTYSNVSTSYLGIIGITPTSVYNANFGWETNKKLEIGIDLGVLKDRIYLSGSYYKNRVSDELTNYSLPPTSGASSIFENFPAVLQNSGWEFNLQTTNLSNKDLVWKSSANLTIPNSKLIAFPNITSTDYNQVYAVGQPLTVRNAFILTGVDPTTGLYTFKSSNGNTSSPSYNTDRQFVDGPRKQLYGGFLNSFTYKAISLDIFLEFVKQQIPNALSASVFLSPGAMTNQPVEVLSRWQKPGDISSIEKYTTGVGSVYTAWRYAHSYSSSGWTNGDFLRVKNVSLSYQFPSSWCNKVKVQSCRLYIQGQNLLTFTKYIGDPELSGIGNLPTLRMLTAGIQFTY